jgi:hypothetical protein
MRKIKGLVGIALAGMMIFSAAGCASKEDKLAKALVKTSAVTSYDFKVKGELKVSGQSTEELPQGLDKFTLELDGKAVAEENKFAKLESNVRVGAAGISADTKIIQEMIINGDKADIKMFIQIPEILKAQMGPFLEGFDYIYMDTAGLEKIEKEMNEAAGTPQDIPTDEITKKTANIQKSLLNFIKDYADENGKGIIEDSGKQPVTVNGVEENLQVFKLKIDDAGIKTLLKAYVKDEKRVKEVQDYLNLMEPSEKQNLTPEELTKQIDSLPTMFGKDGLTISFAIKDGYIVHQNINADLLIEGVGINITLSYDIFNINKAEDIKIPTKEEIKALDITELEKMFNAAIPEGAIEEEFAQ